MTDIKKKVSPGTYYFSTFDFGLAFEVLDIEPHQVYKTDAEGIYHLLKSIIINPTHFTCDEGDFIPIELGTDLKKIVEETREMSGHEDPQTWSPPKDKTKVEEPEMLNNFHKDSKQIEEIKF